MYINGEIVVSYKGGWIPYAHAIWWDKLRYGRDISNVPQVDNKTPDKQPESGPDKDKHK